MKTKIERQTKLYVVEVTKFSGEDYPYGVFINKNDADEWLDKHAFGYEEDNISGDDDIVTCEDYIAREYTVIQDIASIGPDKSLLSDPNYKAHNDMFPAICKIWGIAWDNEKGESNPFSFEEYKGNYQLSKANGLTDLRNGGVTCTSIMLTQLLAGELTIKKEAPFAKPIKCNDGDRFRYVSNNGNLIHRYFAGRTFDLYLLREGNMFAPDTVLPQKQIDSIVAAMKGA